MSVLADKRIRRYLRDGLLEIDPAPTDRQIQPASIDLTLADDFKVYLDQPIDMADVKGVETKAWTGSKLVLLPNDFVLARTVERIRLPEGLVGRVEGKSSLGRLGLSIHSTAGFIDPGFNGTITLEISNANVVPITLRSGRSICQLSLITMTDVAERPYGHPDLQSKYQDQVETTGSRYEG